MDNRMGACSRGWIAAIGLVIGGSPSGADDGRPPAPGPEILEQLGGSVSMDLPFRDERGKLLTLREATGGKPFLLALVYYRCPMLCNLMLGGILETLLSLGPSAGEEFNVVTVSFDPSEGPELASGKKFHYLRAYGRPSGEAGWRFLSDYSASAERLCRETGFRVVLDPKSGLFGHASAILVLTPEGRISRYFRGVSYPARDVRLSLVEASRGKIGSASDRLLLLCLSYDPRAGRYTLAVWKLLRIASAATVLGLGLLVGFLSRRARRRAGDPAQDPLRPSRGVGKA